MKKYALLSLILALLLSACTSTPAQNGTTDASEETRSISSEQYDRFRAGTYATFAETDDCYFWIALNGRDERIHYYEKSSGASGFLCFKPECRHDDRSCDAFVGNLNLKGSLSVRDGMLYWIGYDVSIDPDIEDDSQKMHSTFGIWRMKMDGREREYYGSLNYDEYKNYSYQMAYLWGDYYYFAGSKQIFKPGASGKEPGIIYRVTLTRVPVSGGPVELLQEFTDIEDPHPPMLLLDKDAVYLFSGGWERNSDTSNLTLIKYHIAEKRTEILLKNQEMKCSTDEVRLHPEKGVIVTPGYFNVGTGTNPGDPLVYSLADGQLVPWLDFSESAYTWIRFLEEGMLLLRPEGGVAIQAKYTYELRDMEGNVVSSGIISPSFLNPEPRKGVVFWVIWGSSREFFIEMWDYDTNVHYLVRYRVTPEGLQETLLMQAGDEALTE